MRRALSPVPIAVICMLLWLVALLAYGLASNEPDRGVEEALRRGETEPAPDLELPKLGGRGNGSVADYRGQVVMLNFTEDAEEFIDEYGLTYPMLKDKDGHGIETFGVVQYPETFVIDRSGRITAVRRGPVDEGFMRTEVEPLL